MKKSSFIAALTLILFTGVQGQEDQRQGEETYFKRLKDALATSDEEEMIPSENTEYSDEAANLEVFNDQPDYGQDMPGTSYDYEDAD